MEKLLRNYGFKTLENLKNYIDDYCIESPEDLASAYVNHYDVTMQEQDAVTLFAACK